MNPFLVALLVIVSLGLIFAVWCLTEPFFLDVSRITLIRPKVTYDTFKSIKPARDIKGSPDVRIFFFSDIHAEMCHISPDRILRQIAKADSEAHIDCVIFGGDVTTSPKKADKGVQYLKKIRSGLDGLGIPFYGVTGNHDLELTGEALDKCGFINLEDKVTMLKNVRGQDICLTGADDSGRYNRRWIEPPKAPDGAVNILAIHDPDSIVHINNKPDFMLSGHLHGGQLKLPFNLVFKLLRSDDLPMQGVLQGVFEYGKTCLFISRGVGCGQLPVRFLSMPEVSIVDIYLDDLKEE